MRAFAFLFTEAMAAGLPVIASDTGPIPEVLGGTGLVVKKAPECLLTESLSKLADDRGRRVDMGRAAKSGLSNRWPDYGKESVRFTGLF